MHAAIADKREELMDLCRLHGVTRLEVFGSAARGADFDPKSSDADFLRSSDSMTAGRRSVSTSTLPRRCVTP